MVGRSDAMEARSRLQENSRDYGEGCAYRQFELTARPIIMPIARRDRWPKQTFS